MPRRKKNDIDSDYEENSFKDELSSDDYLTYSGDESPSFEKSKIKEVKKAENIFKLRQSLNLSIEL